MSFFNDLPPRPEKPRQPRNVPPVWAGPPTDELPAVVSLGQFFHQSSHMIVAAKSVEVFSTGCLIEIESSVLRADESDSDWSRVTGQVFNSGPHGLNSENGRGGALQFGVALSDGQKTTIAQLRSEIFEGTEPVTGPILMMAGGGGGSGDDNQVSSSTKFWLWPLPLHGDTRMVAQWDALGMKESSVVVTGEQLGAAAASVQKYWPAARQL